MITHELGSIVALIFLAGVNGAGAASLELERTIPLPAVAGRIDHFAADGRGRRLFVAALGNNSVAVVNLADGKVVSVNGLAEPQGLFYLPDLNRLYVANGGDGTVRVFDGTTFTPLATVKFGDDADNLRYDRSARRLFVGHGSGGLAAIDVATNAIVADIPLRAHPESFQLEQNGPRIFVNVPGAHEITVIDRSKELVVAKWSLGSAAANFPMALDEPNHRLFIGCRSPAQLVIFDTLSGKPVAQLNLHGDCDDLFFDPARRQLYASCGEGFIDVFAQEDADHYARRDAVATESRARTCWFDGERLYLAVPKRDGQAAAVRCYRIAP